MLESMNKSLLIVSDFEWKILWYRDYSILNIWVQVMGTKYKLCIQIYR